MRSRKSEHWAERIQMRPQNRDVLMKMDVKQFIAAMEHWRSYFCAAPISR